MEKTGLKKRKTKDKKSMTKALLIYPEYPDNFWNFKYALKFIGKKAANPPLGLLTVAAMLPKAWEKKLVDLNVKKLKDKLIEWADYVIISAMAVQKESVKKIIKRCQAKGVKIIAGGPLFTAAPEEFKEVDHLILNEAEITLPPFLKDLEEGKPKPEYTKKEFPGLEETPLPLWQLIKLNKYASMNVQYSRGCPYDCEFCDITALFGRSVRTKSNIQVIDELESLYAHGWRGNVFFVDDNFIGNKAKLKEEILPAIIEWMKKRKHPFIFSTEASINLADDEELMNLMVTAGFHSVFIGIESLSEASLNECNKFMNKNRDLLASVKKIQGFGIEVTGGFIVGFDNDTPSVFKKQIEFIQESRIITAMVGLLNAPRDTRLYQRLKKENRLLKEQTGSNTDFSMNFIPKMDYTKLVDGYKEIINGIYAYQPYYERVKGMLKEKKQLKNKIFRFRFMHLKALLDSIFILGIKDKGRKYYWKLFFWTLFRRPRLFPTAITFAIYGYHFRRVFGI